MPLVKLSCSRELSSDVLREISSAVAEVIGKPEEYVMVVAEAGDLLMGGKKDECALAEVKSIGGLNQAVNQVLTQKICAIFDKYFRISATRVYVTFDSVERDHWGWNNTTFG